MLDTQRLCKKKAQQVGCLPERGIFSGRCRSVNPVGEGCICRCIPETGNSFHVTYSRYKFHVYLIMICDVDNISFFHNKMFNHVPVTTFCCHVYGSTLIEILRHTSIYLLHQCNRQNYIHFQYLQIRQYITTHNLPSVQSYTPTPSSSFTCISASLRRSTFTMFIWHRLAAQCKAVL